MPSIKSIISGHNKYILRSTKVDGQPARQCNCRDGQGMCPVGGQCLKSSLVYKAEVINTAQPATYIGLTGNSFKERFTGHNSTFRNIKTEHSTSLSTLIWKLKRSHVNYHINWSIIKQAPTYNTSSRVCKLCNMEKVLIFFNKDPTLLNKRSEINNKCPHRRDFLLLEHLDDDVTWYCSNQDNFLNSYICNMYVCKIIILCKKSSNFYVKNQLMKLLWFYC